jgi:hypothetical protein
MKPDHAVKGVHFLGLAGQAEVEVVTRDALVPEAGNGGQAAVAGHAGTVALFPD